MANVTKEEMQISKDDVKKSGVEDAANHEDVNGDSGSASEDKRKSSYRKHKHKHSKSKKKHKKRRHRSKSRSTSRSRSRSKSRSKSPDGIAMNESKVTEGESESIRKNDSVDEGRFYGPVELSSKPEDKAESSNMRSRSHTRSNSRSLSKSVSPTASKSNPVRSRSQSIPDTNTDTPSKRSHSNSRSRTQSSKKKIPHKSRSRSTSRKDKQKAGSVSSKSRSRSQSHSRKSRSVSRSRSHRHKSRSRSPSSPSKSPGRKHISRRSRSKTPIHSKGSRSRGRSYSRSPRRSPSKSPRRKHISRRSRSRTPRHRKGSRSRGRSYSRSPRRSGRSPPSRNVIYSRNRRDRRSQSRSLRKKGSPSRMLSSRSHHRSLRSSSRTPRKGTRYNNWGARSRSPKKGRSRYRSRSISPRRQGQSRSRSCSPKRGRNRSRSRSLERSKRKSRSKSNEKANDDDLSKYMVDSTDIPVVGGAAVPPVVHVPEKPSTVELVGPAPKVGSSGGKKTIAELTAFCKRLTEARGIESKDSQNGNDSNHNDEGESVTISHPFLVKAKPDFLIPSVIFPVKALPPTTDPNKPLTEQFPVSCGSKHHEKEDDDTADDIINDVDGTLQHTPQVFEQPVVQVKLDISDLVVKRMDAQRRLHTNPHDVEAMLMEQEINMKMQNWAQSNIKPGQFTGHLAKSMMSKELLTSGIQAWAKKDMFRNLAPVSGGVGMRLLQKMGWQPGQVLGKRGEGLVEPLALTVKVDRRGLSSGTEKHGGKKSVAKVVNDIQGKHPISALQEYCARRKWPLPDFTLIFDHGPPHSKQFLFKVVVNGFEYQSQIASGNKKHAKAQAAVIALKGLGVMPEDAVI